MMNVNYKSEIGRGMLLIVLIMITHIPVIILLVNPALWTMGLITFVLSVAFFWFLYQNVLYQISYDGELRIKAPFFAHTITDVSNRTLATEAICMLFLRGSWLFTTDANAT